MPGDSLGRLDVQFGGLDLQFGPGASSAGAPGGAPGAGDLTTTGFEFGASSTDQDKDKKNDAFAPPSAKEVNKSLSNALTSGGKLNPSSSTTAQQAVSSSSVQDSFSKAGGSTTAGNHVAANAMHQQQGGYKQQADLYSNYNNSYNKGYNQYSQYQQQYANSNNFSSQQQGSAHQPTSNSSGYKGGQYDKFDPSLNNPAAAVLGLANTNTTNALSGKDSATMPGWLIGTIVVSILVALLLLTILCLYLKGCRIQCSK